MMQKFRTRISRAVIGILLSTFCTGIMSSCNRSGGDDGTQLMWILIAYVYINHPGNPQPPLHHQPNPYIWYNSTGTVCAPFGPGCNYFSDGLKIRTQEDPYYSSSSTWDNYSNSWYSSTFGTRVVASPSGIIYSYFNGNALNADTQVAEGKDIVNSVAKAKEKSLQAAGNYLSEKFSLSNDEGLRVATTLSDFVALKSRSMQDLSDFSKRLYGVNLNVIMSAADAAQRGNYIPMNSAIQAASDHLNTSPEAIKQLVQELHGHLLAEQGIEL